MEIHYEGTKHLLGRFSFVVSNGRRVKFWTDKWCGDEPLCVSFSSLYALAISKDAWVVYVWVQLGEKGHFYLFIRNEQLH